MLIKTSDGKIRTFCNFTNQFDLFQQIKDSTNGFQEANIFRDFKLILDQIEINEVYWREKQFLSFREFALSFNDSIFEIVSEFKPITIHRLGDLLPEHLEKGSMDYMESNLDSFDNEFKSIEYIRLVQSSWVNIRTEFPFLKDIKHNGEELVTNILHGDAQLGKTRPSVCLVLFQALWGYLSINGVMINDGIAQCQKISNTVHNIMQELDIPAEIMDVLQINKINNIDNFYTRKPTIVLTLTNSSSIQKINKIVNDKIFTLTIDEADTIIKSPCMDQTILESNISTLSKKTMVYTTVTATPMQICLASGIKNIIKITKNNNHCGFSGVNQHTTKIFGEKQKSIDVWVEEINSQYVSNQPWVSGLYVSKDAAKHEDMEKIAREISIQSKIESSITFTHHNKNRREFTVNVFINGSVEQIAFQMLSKFERTLQHKYSKIHQWYDQHNPTVKRCITLVSHNLVGRGVNVIDIGHKYCLTLELLNMSIGLVQGTIYQIATRLNGTDNYRNVKKTFMARKYIMDQVLYSDKYHDQILKAAHGRDLDDTIKNISSGSDLNKILNVDYTKKRNSDDDGSFFIRPVAIKHRKLIDSNLSLNLKEYDPLNKEDSEKLQPEENNDMIPSRIYQINFEKDLIEAANSIPDAPIELRRDAWSKMDLICDPSSKGRQTWLFICENFIRGDQILTSVPYKRFKDMASLINFQAESISKRRRSWRAKKANGKHIIIKDNMMSLSWK